MKKLDRTALASLAAHLQREREFNKKWIAPHERDGRPFAADRCRELVAQRDVWLAALRQVVDESDAGAPAAPTLADLLRKVREQFRMGAPYGVEYKTGYSNLNADLYANGALMARFDSEADAEALAELLNAISREPQP